MISLNLELGRDAQNWLMWAGAHCLWHPLMVSKKNENKMGYGQCQEQAAGETMSTWGWVEGVDLLKEMTFRMSFEGWVEMSEGRHSREEEQLGKRPRSGEGQGILKNSERQDAGRRMAKI